MMSSKTQSKKEKKPRFTAKTLLALGVPAVLIPGLLVAYTLGWNGKPLSQAVPYHTIKTVFPYEGTVMNVIDGDTFELDNGTRVRLIGINAPGRGEAGYDTGKTALSNLTLKKHVYLEYDRYQDDKYGRVLAWVWLNCEGKPHFLPADYMHKSFNSSNPGLTENPKNCGNGTLVNEKMVRDNFAVIELFKERGELKYEKRLILK